MDSNLISIILPVYNGEKYLAMSIESCLNQTYKNIELIIVNDCSTDQTLNIARGYAKRDHRVRIISNAENKKLPTSLNIGHKAAKGDFTTWTSDDNLYELNALEVMINEIFEKKSDIVYSNFTLIDDEGHKVREVCLHGFENIIFGNFIACCFLYKREVFERNNGYNEKLFLVEDYDFWLRALLHSSYAHLKIPLYRYRKHGNSLTNEIAVNEVKKELWKKNVAVMYTNFCRRISGSKNDEISEFLTYNLTYQAIEFDDIIKIKSDIENFKQTLKKNPNFFNGRLVEKTFLNRTIELMVLDKSKNNSRFSNVLFILKCYLLVLDKKNIKTMIRYSVF